MRHYIGGQVALMPELTALYSPTDQRYKRYVPGVWAPLTASWGVENRTMRDSRDRRRDADATRVEYRQTAADINPYIAMATCLAAGLYGIEQRARAASAGKRRRLPGERSAQAAPAHAHGRDASSWRRASAAREILGDAFVDHYVRTRDWEVRQYERAVTDWELKRYFESI